MYKLIRDLEDFDTGTLDPNMPVFIDTETSGDPGNTEVKLKKSGEEESGGLYGKVRLIQIYQEGWKEAILFDCIFVDFYKVLDIIKPLHLVFHNGSYDLHTINCYTDELWLPSDVEDTIYLSRLKYFDKTQFDFYSCLDYAGLYTGDVASLDKKENQKADWSKALTSKLKRYAAYDVLYLCYLYQDVQKYRDTEVYMLDKTNLVHAIEYNRNGLPIDLEELSRLEKKCVLNLETALTDIPPDININSPKQCQEWLGSDSAAKDVLGLLAIKGDTRAEMLIQAKGSYKLLSFIKNYNNERVYGFHNASGARTGRMSCSGGNRIFCNNIQQTPKFILSAIAAESGKVIVYKDYAGIELRMAVTWTGEPTMSEKMFKGEDLHTHTGSIIFGVPIKDVTDDQRFVGKILNFLMIYGGSVKAAQATFISWGGKFVEYTDVKKLIAKWFKEYPYFTSWHDLTSEEIRVKGYADITTALGRKIRAYSLNDALNFPIQGSSAEVIKTAIRYLYERYVDPCIINVVHDSIALHVYQEQAEMWTQRLEDAMVDAWFYVIKDQLIPDLPMPKEGEIKDRWSPIKK